MYKTTLAGNEMAIDFEARNIKLRMKPNAEALTMTAIQDFFFRDDSPSSTRSLHSIFSVVQNQIQVVL